MISIPKVFAAGTVAREGQRGEAWLRVLPGLVNELLSRWDCIPDGQVGHGQVGVVVPVRQRSGRQAALKISFPHPGNVHEPDAFAAWGGRGAVLIYERDDERYAMLLERVQAATLAAVTDNDEVASVGGGLCRRLAVAAPAGLPRLSEEAGHWEEELKKDAAELRHASSGYAVDAAICTVRELAKAHPGTLIHGDFHARNILRASREPWLAIDPKGCIGDPAYDGATFIMTFIVRLLEADDPSKALRRVLDIFAEAALLDREHTRRWTQLRIVQAAFWGRRHGFGVARSGPQLKRLVEIVDSMADALT